jgi:hypothetical protein
VAVFDGGSVSRVRSRAGRRWSGARKEGKEDLTSLRRVDVAGGKADGDETVGGQKPTAGW